MDNITQQTKSLHYIVINECKFSTQLRYNTDTNYIGIGTTHQYRNKDKAKMYYENNKNELLKKAKDYYKINKDKINAKVKIYYEKNKNKKKIYTELHRDPNTPRFGSLEDRINRSCISQGIPVKDFNGFIRDQKYCDLWTEKFRQSIRDRYHNKCYLCNNTQDRKLSVHHVNYDKSCLCQKTCEFIPLCSKCHTKTNYNRQMWEDLIMNYLYPERYFMMEI